MPGLVYEKVISNTQEAKARDSRLIGVTAMDDTEAADIFDSQLSQQRSQHSQYSEPDLYED